MFFPGFDEWDLDLVTGVRVHGRSGGSGPAVVLLHGHPRAHTTWYRVAPLLAERGFTVVCPDLRGYGRSGKPSPDAAHTTYSDRSMANDVVALLHQLGHDRFSVVGHDRGQGVAYRCALDHPDLIRALAVLDGVPLAEAVERADARFATKWWHWFFFAGSPHAERVINADPIAWYGLDDKTRAAMGAENFEYVAAALQDPDTVRGMLEDYRAGLSVDDASDRADRERGHMITCPTLVAWSIHDDMEHLYGDPSTIWRDWVEAPIHTARIDSGHHMAEENPEQLATVLTTFLVDIADAKHDQG
ncbi:alpha/beta fold hydrolase [Pedococcus bigeumensis]|uniref:Alpha/beta hydrolase n=1 Tax=Pedococcus bigeumensis TaxID=433644 RepID=A0A502CL07_9MICO|nr:alpha/beta hydrolase [Pedococcus bigeumensis]TPG13432.1 alpha/beta hydrolase [Pedococcus bigeumensis]